MQWVTHLDSEGTCMYAHVDIGLNFYFVHHVIHTIFIHTSVNRIWSEAHRLILTISSTLKMLPWLILHTCSFNWAFISLCLVSFEM